MLKQISRIRLVVTFSITILGVTVSNASTLTGTILDETASPIQHASVILSLRSGATYIDSVYSDSDGNYSFSNFQIGSYRLSVRKANLLPKDTSILLGSGNTAVNLTVTSVPTGTYHSGEVQGIWLPSGNPHRILTSVTVKDSLYIAPGCTLISEDSTYIHLNGNLKIGSQAGPRSYIAIGSIDDQDTLWNILFQNSDIFGVCTLKTQGCGGNTKNWYLVCNHFSMNSCSFSSPGYKTIAAKSTHIDSSQFSISEQTGAALSFYAKDTIMVTRSSLLGTTWNGYFGPCSPPSHTNLFLTARDIILDRFLVYNNSTNIRNHIRELDIRYCIFDKYLSVERYYADDSSFNISHSNISGLNYRTGNIGNDNISNNIIRQIWFFNNASDTLYVSPFSYNIIDSLPYGTPYFGFLKNIQRNIKGDSCDLWFNQKVDPQIVDESNGTLAITSPALGAASDGTNIGYYQGAGVGVIAMDPYRNRREEPCLFRSIPGRYNSAINVQFVLPEPGKVDFRILTLFGQTVKIVSANFPNAGKHELLVNSGNLTAGMYVCKLEAAELTSIRRLVVLK